jgi:hypothetical protein
LPAEIDSLIVSKINSIFGGSSLQSVSDRWRSAALASAPLPLIINADYTLSNLFFEGPDFLPQKMHAAITHPDNHSSTYVGSLESWIVQPAFDPHANLIPVHDHCRILQPIN